MWRKLWNWLKGIWTWILSLFHPTPDPSESPPAPRRLTEAGYERIMRRLLDQLDPNFDQQALQGFLKEDRISETDLVEWLERAGVQWIRTGEAQRLERLGQLGRQLPGDLGGAARGLWEHFNSDSPSDRKPEIPAAAWPIPVPTASPAAQTPEAEPSQPPDQTGETARPAQEQPIDPQEVERLFQQGLVLAGADRRQEALTHWDLAIAIDDTQARLWSHRGAVLVALHLHEQALVSLDRALELDPQDALALAKRGEALVELQRIEAALTDLEQAVDLDPTLVEGWYFRGRSFVHLGRWEEGIHCFDQALALQPILHIAWIARAEAALSSTYAALAATGSFHPQPALNQRGLNGAIASLKAGQRQCTLADHPLKWQALQDKILELSKTALG